MAKEFKEKTIIINLSKVFQKPTTKRSINAKFLLKKAVTKETRLEDLAISNKLNEFLWSHGKYWAPRKITIKVIKEKERGIIMLPEEKYEPKQDKKKTEAGKKEETKTPEKKDTPKTEQKNAKKEETTSTEKK